MSEEFLKIEASAGPDGKKGFRVNGLAYSGGKMRLPGWRFPVVVDLAGLQVPQSVPLLANHENRTGSRMGMVVAQVQGNVLSIEGEILSSSGQAQGIVEQGKAGRTGSSPSARTWSSRNWSRASGWSTGRNRSDRSIT